MQEHTKRRTKTKKKWREKVVDYTELARNKLAQNEPERGKKLWIILNWQETSWRKTNLKERKEGG